MTYDGTNAVTVDIYDGTVAGGNKLFGRTYTASAVEVLPEDGIPITTTLRANITQSAGTVNVCVLHGGVVRA